MATRNIVPRATGEGGIGTAAKKWALGWINALVVATINALTLAAQSIGFTISGGTTSKTLTVSADTTLDEAVAMSSKAPKDGPSFTGHVKGTEANKVFATVNPTSPVYSVGGGFDSINFLDNQSMTITMTHNSLFIMLADGLGKCGLFFAVWDQTMIELSDPSNYYAVADTDLNPGWAIFKGANAGVVTIKNYTNATTGLVVNIFGQVQATSVPA